MAPETRARMFEPFYTTKPAGKGTGLGLATVYGIVQGSGGEIRVTSDLGLGTTFSILLPEEGEVAAPGPEESPRGGETWIRGGETVLLVDDDEGVREFARPVLLDRGYEVLVAADGQDALRVAQQYGARIHLVLTDVIMPRMNGIELARVAAKWPAPPAILFISGYVDTELPPQHGFLRKPFAIAQLLAAVRNSLDAVR